MPPGPPRPAAAAFADDPGIPPWIGHALILAAGAAYLLLAFAYHPVGDYYTESDFYGGYADGARQILDGRIDPSRYGVVGPVYEVLLAALTGVTRDPFAAARLLSVAAAIAVLAGWRALVRRRLGQVVALVATLLLALNPVFARYGISATTDLPALALQTLALLALLGAATPRRAAIAGATAGVAILTRYSNVFLIPVSIAVLLWTDVTDREHRGRSLAGFLAGLVAILAPWTLFTVAHGHWPGEVLVRSFGFYFDPGTSRNVQDLPSSGAHGHSSLTEIVSRPAVLFSRLAGNLIGHLVGDARALLGWPVALLAAAGLVASATPRWRPGARPITIAFAGAFLILLPVFHSERYSLPLAPFYVGFAGVAIATVMRPGWGRVPGWGVLAVTGVWSLLACIDQQVRVHRQLPVEVVAAGKALAADPPPGGSVLSRKGHIGYYASRPVAEFPRVSTLAELAAAAQRQNASHLYYSWYEASLRPEFVWLLDTTATAPGLTRLYTSSGNPAVLYRLGAGFGTDPAWMDDDYERRLHEARARIQVDPDSLRWTHRTVLGVDALRNDRPADALELVAPVTREHPDEALAWVVSGEAHRRLHDLDAAAGDFRRALALDSTDVDARSGLDQVLRERSGAKP